VTLEVYRKDDIVTVEVPSTDVEEFFA